METTKTQSKNVTVIGLGNMGATIARLFLDKGYQVNIWNRTRSKGDSLVKQGAIFTATAEDAVSASPVVMICVYDYSVTHKILYTKEITDLLNGKILIQLTTGSPQEARESAAWAHRFGAEWLDGAIQVAPEQMGKADTPILFSGKKMAYTICEPILNTLGGGLVYLGEDEGSASAMDLATLSSIYGTLFGFFHGALISESAGFNVEKYATIVADILPSFSQFLKHEASVIQSGNFQTSQSPLSISIAATERLVQTAREAGINTDFPIYAASVLKKAQKAGYEDEELAAVIKTLRRDIHKEAAYVS